MSSNEGHIWHILCVLLRKGKQGLVWGCGRAFVKEMSDVTSTQFDPAALGVAGHLPVESAMPGTTLQLIALDPFESGGILYGALVHLGCMTMITAVLHACPVHQGLGA